MTLWQVLTLVLAGAGVILTLISSFGLVRLQGVHRRMQASSVGASIGITLLLLSAGVYYADSAQFGRMVLLILFFFTTAPIATTAMARAAYRALYAPYVRPHLIHDDMADPRYRADYTARQAASSDVASGEESI